MGIISAGIQSIATERAKATCRIERVYSEVTESVSDEMVAYAVTDVFNESGDDIDLSELDALLSELPVDADMEKEEIIRVLASEDDTIDIDDIVGVTRNAE